VHTGSIFSARPVQVDFDWAKLNIRIVPNKVWLDQNKNILENYGEFGGEEHEIFLRILFDET